MERLIILYALSMLYSDIAIGVTHGDCSPGDLLKYFGTVISRIDVLIAAIASLMTLLKFLSWALGKIGGRLESFSAKPVVYLGRFIGWIAYGLGVFAVGDIPKTVKHKPRFVHFFK